ncbi:phage portal protein [Brevibacillus laterosporus]|uniref:phage portal protein n=1 Tax=Brevibacillus laterosporus TaxID=1465 RepID=UPI0003B1BA13|nr:phage portal protein [Brevibacillus laterosporus]ERM17254.1 portal protein [Brevibacillus laterosporus PE36]
MGLLTDLVGKRPYSMDDFTRDARSFLRGKQALSGVTVNEETALRYITVYSCVRVLAETLGSLPLSVHLTRSDGGSDKAQDHPVYELIHDLPNDEMTTQTWREASMGHLTLSGNCYSIITHNNKGQVVDLYPVDWHMVDPKRNPSTGKIEYHIVDRGKVEVFPIEKVFHIPGFGFDGIKGYSPIRMAAESIGIGMAASEFSARFYGQGMNIGGVLEHPSELSDEAYGRLQTWIEEKGSGMANSWLPLILEGGMKFSRIPMPLTDAQFVETRKFTRDEIGGLFRVPPHMIGNLERATFSNIEHQGIEFVQHTMLPYITRWEQAINWKLFTKDEREKGYYARFNLSGLLRGDYKSRQEGLAIMRQNGVINADTWRGLEGMNPIDGPEGQEYLVNGNMIPVTAAASKGGETVK